jgi:uncharacterized protein (DUF58 family)
MSVAPSSWWPILALLFFIGILLKFYLLAAFAVMLFFVGALARWWQRHALDNVIFRRLPFYKRGFPGEEIPLKLEVENHKFLPLSWLRVRDSWPYVISPLDENLLLPTHDPRRGDMLNLFSLRWFERARRSYNLVLRKRGVYTLGPAKLESGDLFGLFDRAEDFKKLDYITVFPTPVPFERLRLPADDPFGDRRAVRRLFEDLNQPMGVRDYHPEDDFRHMHWPATAHTGELQVRVYQPVSAQVLVICLNVTTFKYHWEGVDPELLEHLVSVTASLVQRALEDGFRVGLLSNGALAHADQPFRVPPGRSPKQMAQLLETLAGVTPLVTAPFERLLVRDVPRLPYGARLLIVTATVTDELSSTLMRLKQHGRRITLLSFAEAAPREIPGVRVFHTPFVR